MSSDSKPATEKDQSVGWVSPKGVTQRSAYQAKAGEEFESVGLRPKEVPVGREASPTYGTEWRRLGEHCLKIGSGATPTGGKDAYLEAGPYSLIRSQNIYNDGFKPGGLAFISDEQARKLDGVAVEEGDVLLNITGDSVARVCLALPQYMPARVNQHVAIIRPDPLVWDNRFLRYFLASPYQQNLMLGMAAIGATRNALTKAMIESFKVPCPLLKEQKVIADILEALDDRITLLRETNATLEAIAQALFKSWFVDFDPVHANIKAAAEGRAAPAAVKPNAVSGAALDTAQNHPHANTTTATNNSHPATTPAALDPATAALFPSSFQDSELGLIPEGWRWSSLGEVSTVGIGKTPPRKEPEWFSANRNDVPWVSIKDMGGEGLFICQTSEYLTQHAIEKFNVRLVPDNTVLLSFKLTVGRLSITDGEMVTNEAIAHFKLDGQSPVTTPFVYLALRQFNFSSLSSTSSIADAVNSKTVRDIPILLPSKAIVSAFSNYVGELFGRIKMQEKQAQTLTQLRDTLLPRLISGQLRLPDAQEKIEEALA